MRIILSLIVFGFSVALIVGLGQRIAPTPASIWHLDPADVSAPDAPQYVLLRGRLATQCPGSVANVSAEIDEIVRGDGGRLIAGSLVEGHMTYVLRARVFGYPDAISFRVRSVGDEAAVVEVFSRSPARAGLAHANAAQIDRWMSRLTS